MQSRLKYFPVPLFGAVMGILGLAIAYEKASILNYPLIIGNIVAWFGLVLFLFFFIAYFLKYIKYPEMVKEEFSHPIRINFFPAISISLLLISIAFSKINPIISKISFFIGASLHLFFTLYVVRFWIVNNLKIEHSNPAWFIPIVGNVIVPIMGVKYLGVEIAQFYFSIGIFFWVVLFTIILYRIIFHHQFPAKFLPTLFIFIAPAAVGFISYVKINEAIIHFTKTNNIIIFDFFAHFLYNIGLFFTLLVFFMIRLFSKVSYAITWWAYTFPMAAMTIATILHYHLSKEVVFYYLANAFLIITTFIIGYVAIKTINAAFKKEICIPE